jgi:tetrahydromethanopterin S-methyltransferase subunit A
VAWVDAHAQQVIIGAPSINNLGIEILVANACSTGAARNLTSVDQTLISGEQTSEFKEAGVTNEFGRMSYS